MMEAQVKAIKDAGANVVVAGGKVADMALHYANKYQLMVVRYVVWEKRLLTVQQYDRLAFWVA